jgi:hypothetical protein
MLKPLSYLLFVVLLTGSVATAAPADPGPQDKASLQLTAVPSKETYSPGESVPIKVSVTNISTEPVVVAKPPLDFILGGFDLRGDMKRPSGANVSIFPGTKHTQLYQFKSTDFITLAPGQSLDWTITAVANIQHFSELNWDAAQPDGSWRTSNALDIYFSEPGTYTFTLTLQNSVQSYRDSPDEQGQGKEHSLPAWTGTLQTPATSFTITPAKPLKE